MRRGSGHWEGVNPHDRLELTDDAEPPHLEGDDHHHSYDTRDDHLTQIEYLPDISSRKLFKRGETASWPLIAGMSGVAVCREPAPEAWIPGRAGRLRHRAIACPCRVEEVH